jgi:hypothetical protein
MQLKTIKSRKNRTSNIASCQELLWFLFDFCLILVPLSSLDLFKSLYSFHLSINTDFQFLSSILFNTMWIQGFPPRCALPKFQPPTRTVGEFSVEPLLPQWQGSALWKRLHTENPCFYLQSQGWRRGKFFFFSGNLPMLIFSLPLLIKVLEILRFKLTVSDQK